MSDRSNRLSRHNGAERFHSEESDLFAHLIDNPVNSRTGLDSIPPEVLKLVETTNRLRTLDLPPARPAFRTALRANLMRRLASAPKPVTFEEFLASQWHNFSLMLKKRATQLAAASAVTLAVALVSTGTVYASQSALPGDALYGVKTGFESVQLALASEEQHEALHIAFLNRRVEEINALAEKGRYDDVLWAAESFTNELVEAGTQSNSEEFKNASSNAVIALTKVLEQVPEQARPAIEKVLQKISERQGPSTNTPGAKSTETPGKTDKDDPANVPGKKPTEKPKNVPTQKPENKPAETQAAPGKP